jgi:hypothetical protein
VAHFSVKKPAHFWVKINTRPEVKAKYSAAMADPEVKARRIATNKEVNARPEVKAQRSVAQKAHVNTPEGAAVLARAQAVSARKRLARKVLAPFLRAPITAQPSVTVWNYRPGSSLGITTINAIRRGHATQGIVPA